MIRNDRIEVEQAVARGHTPENIAIDLVLPLKYVLEVVAVMDKAAAEVDTEHFGNVRTGHVA